MNESFILILLEYAKKYPHVFKIAAEKPGDKGTWGAYRYDDVMSIWIDTSHPVAISFFKEERENRMGYELTVQEQKNLAGFLEENRQRIEAVLPPDVKKIMTPARLTQIAYQALVENPTVGRCEPASIVNAIIGAASMGLQIGGELGQASLVPFKNRAKLMVEWRGYMAYANKTGKVKDWFISPVYENERFEIKGGNHQEIIHYPMIGGNKGKLVAAYAMCRIIGDDRDKFVVIDEPEAERIKKHSAANRKEDSPWNTMDEVRMWMKTAVKQLCRTYLLPLSPDIAKIITVDNSAESEAEQFEYIHEEQKKPVTVTPDTQPDEGGPLSGETRGLLFKKMRDAGLCKSDMTSLYDFALQKQKATERWGKEFLKTFDLCLDAWKKIHTEQAAHPVTSKSPPESAPPADTHSEAPPESALPEKEKSQTLPNVQKHLAMMKEENPEGFKEACQMLDVDPNKPHDDSTAQEILGAMSVIVS